MTLREKWIAALRSGEYVQTNGVLRNAQNGFCCLGVCADLIGEAGWERHAEWGDELIGEVILDDCIQQDLAELNDNGKTFPEIADYIEAHPEIDPQWPEGVAG